MELERSVGDRIVNVVFDGIGWNDVVDLVVRHGAGAKVVETRDEGKDDDKRDQQLFYCEVGPPGKDGFVEPAVIAGFVGGSQAFNGHKFVSGNGS